MQAMSTNNYIKSFILLLGLACVLSCSEESAIANVTDAAVVNLTLELSQNKGNTTRSSAGIDQLNENTIKKIDLFLYKKGGAEAGEQPAYVSTDIAITNYDAGAHRASISLSLPLGAYNQLFPDEGVTQCDAYIIVNRQAVSGTDNALPSDDLSMQSVKGSTVLYSSQFQQRVQSPVTVGESVEYEYNTTVQDDFVMEGYAVISRSNLTLTGTVPVERVAVKISLIIDGIKDRVEDTDGKIWNPDKQNVMFTMRGGVNRTTVGIMPDRYLYTPNKETDRFDLRAIALNTQEGDNLTTKYPLYTYPTNWGADEESRTYFILVVNWTREDDNTIKKTTYYEIPVNPAGTYLKRNTYYKIKQKVEVLGSEEEESPVVLYPCNYVILDWGNTMVQGDSEETDVDAEINKLKFLVLDETAVELNNTQSRQLYFFSSDPVEILNVKVEKNNVSNNISSIQEIANVAAPVATNGKYTIPANSNLVNPVTLSIYIAGADDDDSRNCIFFEHVLENHMNSSSDYSEYIITFDVQHVGDDKYSETVKITQYPMISIVTDPNTDYSNDSNTNGNKGYVYINNAQSTSSGWNRVYGLTTESNNQNPNRYIITVNSLTEEAGEDYIIGDPRSKTVSNPSSINKDKNSRSLTYYYPTSSADMTKEMIAPAFMVASSYGVCTTMSSSDAQKRCATYQEDGYPAGRWRVPTEAEVKYIMQLSGWGIIPVLFTADNNYWSAHSAVKVSSSTHEFSTTTATSAYVRCVYDTWYWGDERVDKSTFTYGDKQR